MNSYIHSYMPDMGSTKFEPTVRTMAAWLAWCQSARGGLRQEVQKMVLLFFLKKNQNASRPSEHPPVRGKKMPKRLGGIIGCKYKISS